MCRMRCWFRTARDARKSYPSSVRSENVSADESVGEFEALEELLELAHRTVMWADQCYEGIKATAGGKHYWPKRQAYVLARVEYLADRRAFRGGDLGGCVCKHTPAGWDFDPECAYHLAAKRQPWNHRIPWNCPTFYDGCNCDGGPFYDAPEGALAVSDRVSGSHRVET